MYVLPPLSLYVHIPWCLRKCPYCDFNSHATTGDFPEADYVETLLDDLEHQRPLAQGRPLHSIFIGGGTPSLFQPASIEQIIDAARTKLGFDRNIEITLEANPGTFEQQRFFDYRQAGVNRLSIGIQSFQNQQLQALGRVHDGQQAIAALEMARKAGFDNINLDLMHGLPGQSPQAAIRDLQTALRLAPEHLSWYQLTIEPNTEFFSRPPSLPVEDDLCEIQDQGHQLLTESGYRQYEVSAYSRPDRPSRHNLNYWQFGDYLAIGAGAHGKITQPENDQIWRWRQTRMPEHYVNCLPAARRHGQPVDKSALPLEFMMNALRLVDGVPKALFEQRTGLDLTTIDGELNQLVQLGLMEHPTQSLRTTATGFRFLNNVLAHFDA